MKKWILVAIESILLWFTFSCLECSYSIYFGNALAGTYEYGIGLLLFGWIPCLIGVILIPFNILIIIIIVKEFKKINLE